uniref:hypothetical protein n=1 Tax=Endozoicomonas sp. SESOKO4 TaxID=2828745 RepID=UPI0021474D99
VLIGSIYRIIQQVNENLLQFLWIARHSVFRITQVKKADIAALSSKLQQADRLLNTGKKINGFMSARL